MQGQDRGTITLAWSRSGRAKPLTSQPSKVTQTAPQDSLPPNFHLLCSRPTHFPYSPSSRSARWFISRSDFHSVWVCYCHHVVLRKVPHMHVHADVQYMLSCSDARPDKIPYTWNRQRRHFVSFFCFWEWQSVGVDNVTCAFAAGRRGVASSEKSSAARHIVVYVGHLCFSSLCETL